MSLIYKRKIPVINEEYLIDLKKSHIDNFKDKINKLNSDSINGNVKDHLINILDVRLSGVIPKKKFTEHTLDWSDAKFEDSIDYFENFDNYYFELDKFLNENNNIFTNRIFDEIKKISNAYDDLKNINYDNNLGIKKYIVLIQKLMENYDDCIESLQYTLMTFGFGNFIDVIFKLYPDAFDFTFNKIINKLSKKMTFEDFTNMFSKALKEYINNYIISNKEFINKGEIKNLMNIYHSIDKNVKCIFWIIYHDELKYYNDVINKYLIEMNYSNELYTRYEIDENEILQIIEIEEKGNFLSNELEKNIDLQIKNLNTYKNNLVDNLTDREKKNDKINELIEEEINNLINVHIFDPDELIIIKSQLMVQKELIKIKFLLDNTSDVFMDLVNYEK